MAKSARRNRAEGTVDKIAGRALELFSKLTGKRSAGAKGKAARGRGKARSATGRLKRRSGSRRRRRPLQRTRCRRYAPRVDATLDSWSVTAAAHFA